jgi:hypothetical protein
MPMIGLTPFWSVCLFALAFLFHLPYLQHQSRHCESKVRLAPQGTGTVPVLQSVGWVAEYE